MTAYNKLWAALVMAVLDLLREHYNVDLGLDETSVTALVGLVTALLVWAIPNRSR
jgi:hypothetical protein